ncbi:MAG: flavin reductase family protein [Pseudomonadota bacterium]
MSSMFYRPIEGHGLPHDPFKAIVAPRPIGWISTRSADGAVNLAPYSFFNAVAGRPPIVMFSSEGWKDSVANASETGEFACNFVSETQVDAMNETSAALARDVSEFEFAGLAMKGGNAVDVPHVSGCPAVLECKLTQLVQQKDAAGNVMDTHTVFGEVVGVHIADAMLADGLFNTAKARPVMRLGYRDFGGLGRVFQMRRPSDPG